MQDAGSNDDTKNDAINDAVIAATRQWLEKAVIGLNLCPFAKPAYASGRIRFCVSEAASEQALLADLERELEKLAEAPADGLETTLLIHPLVLNDFYDYNDFLEIADDAVTALDLEGIIQVASFHPDYQFADTTADDAGNLTNRSPYPMLHLLREDSVARAVEAHPDTDAIYLRNIETMRRLGMEGWQALGLEAGKKPKA
jgi:hypothetical protein